MALLFLESGGQYHFSKGPNPANLWASISTNALTSTAPAYNGSTYSYTANILAKTPILGAGSFAGMICGYRLYILNWNAFTLLTFLDNGGNPQCDLRMDANGFLFFTRNGTTIPVGTKSATTLTTGVWNYIEFKAIFSTTGTGTCEVYVNGSLFYTQGSLTNATGTATGSAAEFNTPNVGNVYASDFYVLDTVSGNNTTYLGDITVGEIYPNGAGASSQWSQATNNGGAGSPPPFAISSVTSGNIFNRTVTATGETAGAYIGYYFTTSGFTGSNGTFLCTGSSTTTITLSGSSLTGSGSLAFQAIVQAGIHGGIVDGYATTNVGTRPNDDAAYIVDGTANDISDFAHQTLSTTGTLFGVAHMTWARKDDAGTRQIQQYAKLSASTETSATISLTSTYAYYRDVLDAKPGGGAWTVADFNNATFGAKEIT